MTRRLVVAVILLSACASAASWIGRPVADLYREIGPPDSVIDDPACAGCKIHIYVSVGSLDTYTPKIPTMPKAGEAAVIEMEKGSRAVRERRIYYVDAAGVITAFSKK